MAYQINQVSKVDIMQQYFLAHTKPILCCYSESKNSIFETGNFKLVSFLTRIFLSSSYGFI